MSADASVCVVCGCRVRRRRRCVCGKLPFDAGVFLNIVQAIVTGPTPTIDSSAGVSPDFARIVAKAMSKDPDHRCVCLWAKCPCLPGGNARAHRPEHTSNRLDLVA